MYNIRMNEGLLNYLTDAMVEYVLRELTNYSTLDEGTIRRIKAAKIYIYDNGNANYELRIGMGISEASFLLTGEKVSGSVGSDVERFITYWISRPLNQAALSSLINS